MTTPSPERRPKHAANDGALPPWWSALDRRRLAVALGSTFVAVPVVVVDNLPQRTDTGVGVVADVPATTAATAPPSSTTITVETTTTTTAAPTTTATTAAPSTTATTAAPATTTTAPPPPPTTSTTAPPAPAPVATNQESGKATWYRYRDGECAHKTLPRGTVLTVTNVANGASATCVVTDRGPYGGGRVVDLDDGTFARLAPLSAGVIDVTISW